jgi:Mrp family chromosome partitioning ATPase/capsular polysaccharide biosynthesis protein
MGRILTPMNDTTDAASIFAPIWKRKWLILAVGLLVAAGTYQYYKGRTPVYTASTQLYLGGSNEQQNALSTNPGKTTLNGRALTDQVGIINSAIIGEPVRKRLKKEGNIAGARGKEKATASGTSSFITIATEAHTPRGAVALANGYAQAYITRQHANYLRAVRAAIANTRAQIRRLEAAPAKGSKHTGPSGASTLQTVNLNSKLNQLESQLSLSGVQQIGKAKASPLPISPTPKKNAIFGFVLGLALAAVAAFLLSRFDRRQRTLADVDRVFETQVLTALPSVRSPAIRPDGRRAPAKSLLEPMRRLHTALQLADAGVLKGERERHPRVILFLSADAGDGKSTVVANLAHVQCDAGEQVAVIEADFRRPVQARLLDVDGSRGLADVLTGRLSVGEAIQRAAASPATDASSLPTDAASPATESGDGVSAPVPGAVSTVVASRTSQVGSLSVLLSGGNAENPPALLGGQAMGELLRSVADEFDHVLIDAPPPLEVSDVMPLLPKVDGIVIVSRIGHTRDMSAERLVELLKRTSSAPVLGVVANCVQRKDLERSGLSWASGGGGRRRKFLGR